LSYFIFAPFCHEKVTADSPVLAGGAFFSPNATFKAKITKPPIKMPLFHPHLPKNLLLALKGTRPIRLLAMADPTMAPPTNAVP